MTKLLAAAACASVLLAWGAWPAAQTASGEEVYRQRCAGCHDLVSPRIPLRAALQKMPASRILRALDFGVMMNVAYPLRRDEREAVAMFLGSGASDPAPAP
jgi:polyvinyl alcohol dehydrogenase (cytochrome)